MMSMAVWKSLVTISAHTRAVAIDLLWESGLRVCTPKARELMGSNGTLSNQITVRFIGEMTPKPPESLSKPETRNLSLNLKLSLLTPKRERPATTLGFELSFSGFGM